MIHSERAYAPAGTAPGPVGVGDVLLLERFTDADFPRIRQLCLRAALDGGLTRHRALMFVYAVDVGLQNAVRCGGGWGTLHLVRDGRSRLVAEIVDNRADGVASPGASGLWLAERLVDDLTVRSEPHGTTLRIAATLAGPAGYPWADSRYDARLAALIASILFPSAE